MKNVIGKHYYCFFFFFAESMFTITSSFINIQGDLFKYPHSLFEKLLPSSKNFIFYKYRLILYVYFCKITYIL